LLGREDGQLRYAKTAGPEQTAVDASHAGPRIVKGSAKRQVFSTASHVFQAVRLSIVALGRIFTSTVHTTEQSNTATETGQRGIAKKVRLAFYIPHVIQYVPGAKIKSMIINDEVTTHCEMSHVILLLSSSISHNCLVLRGYTLKKYKLPPIGVSAVLFSNRASTSK
jgi:hypothetical protein